MNRNFEIRTLPNSVWYFSFVAILFSAASANGGNVLENLVASYKQYDLPMPLDTDVLATLNWTTGVTNGVRQYKTVLVFVSGPHTEAHSIEFWSGCRKVSIGRETAMKKSTPPTISLLNQTETLEAGQTAVVITSWPEKRLENYPDLALAIQCAERGWNGLATGLLDRSAKQGRQAVRGRRGPPPSHEVRLASMAWNFWCEEFSVATNDRPAIVKKLISLQSSAPGLNTHAHSNVIKDMQQTLEPTNSPVGSVESMIDALMDLGDENLANGVFIRPDYTGGERYRKLKDLGTKAVPVLLKHTHDFRLTRYVEQNGIWIWQVRVADVVRELLNELETEEFAYDVLFREGRGRCIDDAHVNDWWTHHQNYRHPGKRAPLPERSDEK